MLSILHRSGRTRSLPQPRLGLRSPARRRPYATGRTLASIERGPRPDGLARPQTTADQVYVALSVVGRFVKYSAYAGITLGATTLAGFVGMNAWVEMVEMPPPNEGEPDVRYGWEEEGLRGWSGGHLGKGTDPRLGQRARLLLRSAWIAQHWQSGKGASAVASTTSGSGAGLKTVQLVDSGYLVAAKNLSRALHHVQERKGLRLDKQTKTDRALVEMEERLAEVRELVGTREMLIDARRGYERVWESCVAQVERDGHRVGETWEGREAMRVARKMAEVGIKAAALAKPGSKAAKDDLRRAQDILLWASTAGLGVAVKEGEAIRRAQRDFEQKEDPKPSGRGLFSSWGRQYPAVAVVVPVRPEVDLLLLSLRSLTPSGNAAPSTSALTELTPSAARSTISALLSLSSLLVPSNLGLAYDLQTSVQSFLDQAVAPPSEVGKEDLPAAFHDHWLRVRRDLAAVYAAEVSRANRGSSANALHACREAVADTDSVLMSLSQASARATKPLTPRKGRLAPALEGIERDARVTGSMAANLAGLINEVDCPAHGVITSASVPKWCPSEGGDVVAAAFYRTAMRFAAGLGPKGGLAEKGREEGGEEGTDGEGRMWRESYENLVRVRNSMRRSAVAAK